MDLIDRQEVVNALEKVAGLFPYKEPGNRDSYDEYNEAWNDAIGRAEIEIGKLPSAQKTGHWDDSCYMQRCSVCGGRGKKSYKYCPYCGSRNRGEEE